MGKPKRILEKKVENTTNKIRIPKDVVEKMGKDFYMEIYDKEIILRPVKKGN